MVTGNLMDHDRAQLKWDLRGDDAMTLMDSRRL